MCLPLDIFTATTRALIELNYCFYGHFTVFISSKTEFYITKSLYRVLPGRNQGIAFLDF